MRTAPRLALAATVLLLLSPAAEAKKNRPVPTEPGTYVDWNDDLDQVEIVESFRLADYLRVVVGPFATDGVALPEADDNAHEPVKEVLAGVVPPLAAGMREALPGVEVVEGGEAGAGALVVRGRVLEMDPGSRAARYWGGFGAGAARTKLEGEVVDAASGRVLLRFTQERRSGVGMAGGKYVNLMQRNLTAIGEDLGAGLAQFR
jgi:hypothetical protein